MKIILAWVFTIIGLCSFKIAAVELSLVVSGKNIKPGVLHVDFYRVEREGDDPIEWGDIKRLRNLVADYQPDSKPLELNISELEYGPLCIRIFLDQNNNQRLDRSTIGLPIEPVGFANNPSLFMGEPEPDSACFELIQGINVQNITLRQKKTKVKHKNKFKN